jgi:putative hydrolase
VLVVDRPRWIQANLDGFRQIESPQNAQMIERLKQSSPPIANLGPRITGMEVGALLSSLSSKVLGQFGPFFPGTYPNALGRRLLLVAPNIASNVDPADFRPWVCLHEQTHRVQFAAVPWLRGHLNDQIAPMVDTAELDPAVASARGRRLGGSLTSTHWRSWSASTRVRRCSLPPPQTSPPPICA